MFIWGAESDNLFYIQQTWLVIKSSQDQSNTSISIFRRSSTGRPLELIVILLLVVRMAVSSRVFQGGLNQQS